MRRINQIHKPLVFVKAADGEASKCRDFVVRNGGIPITPNLMFEKEDSHFNYVLLGKAEELWCFGIKECEELEIAKRRLVPVRFFDGGKR